MKEQIYKTYSISAQQTGSLTPISDVKTYVGIDVVGDDSMVERMTKTAFDLILFEYDIVSVKSDIVEDVENAPRDISLKFKPIVSGSVSVVRVNDDDTTENVDVKVIYGQYGSKIEIKDNTIPSHIRISYEAGFGTDETSITDPLYNIIRQGVLQSVGTLYEDRENNVMGSMMEIPSSTRNMIDNILNINEIW